MTTKFYIGQRVIFECVGEREGTIIGYNNGIYRIESYGNIFGMKEEDLRSK